jgi:hypothetical protein
VHLVNSRPTLSGREHSCARLLGTASAPWIDTPEHQIGSVREAGMTCGAVFAAASADVRRFGDAITDGINSVTIKEVPPSRRLPTFSGVGPVPMAPNSSPPIAIPPERAGYCHHDPVRRGPLSDLARPRRSAPKRRGATVDHLADGQWRLGPHRR